jgi:hypothetical protein
MSQIFYSEIDKNLQAELDARARAGKTDRSETALRYMTEKIANVAITAYEGNKRDKNKIVHTLGGRNVIGEEYMPGGPNGFLTDRVYTLGESRWAVPQVDVDFKLITSTINNKILKRTTLLSEAITDTVVNTYTNTSKRIPPFITQASMAINDNSRATTNKVTINITIPNPDRDLNFMESVYARPGRYCMVQFEHPDSALMTLNVANINGKLKPSALPARDVIKKNYPEAEAEYDELLKMNKMQFEGLITAFEYTYNQDGTVTMTIYILGTSQTYTDLSMIMQTATTTSTTTDNTDALVRNPNTFYSEIYKEVESLYKRSNSGRTNFASGKVAGTDKLLYWIWNMKTESGARNNYINLNYLIDFLNKKILTKINNIVESPTIYSDTNANCYSNFYPGLVSADPDNILILSERDKTYTSDSYGEINNKPKFWTKEKLSDEYSFYTKETNSVGRTGMIFINLEIINQISTELKNKPDEFTVGKFLVEIGNKINRETAGAIALKLITDPEDLQVLYYRDINWIKSIKNTQPKPYLLPMFASDPRGTVVRDFKLSAKLPSQVQSLMYAINSTDKVSESDLAPYINFMYNNGTSTRTPTTVLVDGKEVIVDELTTYGANKETTEKLARQYADLHDKYYNELLTARETYGKDPTSSEKRSTLQTALKKYLQYPFPTIKQTNQVAAPTFPIEAEFTIDGINGLRYGDILDFPGIPAKYRTNSTFTIKGITHTISTAGEWTTQVSCLMRPKFD